MDILKAAIEAAKKNHISTMVVASTTGATASRLLEFIKGEKLRMIVVTHDEGKSPEKRRFNEGIQKKLLDHGITVYTHNPRLILLRKIIGKFFGKFGIPPWHKHLREVRVKYGTGVKVCHIIVQMLMAGKILKEGRVVAIGGKKSGADSAGIFLIGPDNKWPILEEVITTGRKPCLV